MKVEVVYEIDHKQIRNFVELHSIIYDNDDDNVLVSTASGGLTDFLQKERAFVFKFETVCY